MANPASGSGDHPREETPAATPTATTTETGGTDSGNAVPESAESTQKLQVTNPQVADEDDEDSDFDELDDVLDDFSKPKAAPAPAPAATQSDPTTGVAPPDFDEDAFLKQLEKDMANMMANPGAAGPGAADAQDFQSAVDEGADAFAKQLEESGIPPGDFLKQLLADVMAEENGSAGAEGLAKDSPAASATAPPAGPADGEQPENFNDAIQRTIERMKQSGDRATEAATTGDGLDDDLIAQLLKAVEAGASGAGEDGDLTKMFMGMMEQLSNKEMLYEPMKELDGKFGPWIAKSKAEGTVPMEDMERYETQARVVKQIVLKFEEPGYSDEDAKCREYVWERMQEMQAAGSPPEELISNPLMGELGGAAGGAPGGVPDCPQQ
ncbi:peroxin-19 Pex19-Penicillium chrysogenum [Penicillium brasilianum]|uniref:Peroxin-19 Pex19-Penicillium chrysogenum n=1 Tax=Penicillium brasilianum TaxID=104259 RepID=A0A1S9R8C3_PENBI|nr:peroxin-19 Pex19-Penicillium chrysogenum [Penicillium brasilianum]